MAGGNGARFRQHGNPPQALPYARRNVQSSPRRGSHGNPASCRGFQSRCGAEAMRNVGKALGARDAAAGLYDLAARLHAPLVAAGTGNAGDGIERAAELATQSPYRNPREVEYDGVVKLLGNAWHGTRPREAGRVQVMFLSRASGVSASHPASPIAEDGCSAEIGKRAGSESDEVQTGVGCWCC